MTQQPNQPIKEFRVGGVKAAVWRDAVEQDGRTVIQHSVKITKTYRDKTTDEWKTTDYFFPNDLPKLILVAQRAFEFTSLKESEEAPDLPPVAR